MRNKFGAVSSFPLHVSSAASYLHSLAMPLLLAMPSLQFLLSVQKILYLCGSYSCTRIQFFVGNR
jgi:hypothetical protein